MNESNIPVIFGIIRVTDVVGLLPLQGAEGVPFAYGPESPLHVQPPPAADSGSDADDSQLVLVCVDSGSPAEP